HRDSPWRSPCVAPASRRGCPMGCPFRAVTIAIAAAVFALAPGATLAQEPDSVPVARQQAREWYQNAKFGMFIHWGVYSLLGQGEWVMQNREIPVSRYEWLASAFNPVKFDAHEWVSLAKAAGVRYITITARHHDGFSMFASTATPYNIVVRESSCSSTTRSSTGAIPTTSRAAGLARVRAAPMPAIGIDISNS